MMSHYVIAVYVSFWSWYVHGSHSVYLPKPGVTWTTQNQIKLQPRADGSFKVLGKINDNAYEIDLLDTYGVSSSFSVANLSPFFGLEESRMTLFQGGRMMWPYQHRQP
jgi:hypothetical protein